MKLTVERDNLLSALSHAHRIVAKADTIPILNTVLMAAGEGRIAIKATNIDMIAETGCIADVAASGEAAVPLAPLVALLQRLPAGTALTFDHPGEGEPVAIKYRRSAASFPTLSARDFVAFTMSEGAVEVDIEAKTLAYLLDTPSHAASPDDQRLFAQGVHLHYVEDLDALVGIATNGLRMTRAMMPADEAMRRMPPVTIALKSVAEIVKLTKDVGGGLVRLGVTDRLLSVSADGTTLTTKLIETQYPDYSRHVPADLSQLATMTSHEFGSALQRALILADDRDRIVQCAIADGVLSMSTRSTKGGAIAETVEVEGGDGIRFGMNARFAVEALSAIDADVIELSSSAPSAPILLRKRGSAEVTCLVMPTRT